MEGRESNLESVWGVNELSDVEELKTAIREALEEYLLSYDKEELIRCLREMNVPHFLHEVRGRCCFLVLI